MNILFLTKFYTPFDRGGSEWSTRDLAYLLTKDGHSLTIATPNYGAKSSEIVDGIKVIRIPFPVKLNSHKGSIAPYWTNNILWFAYSAIFCLILAIKNRYEIIHVQNNEFLPAAVITAKILGKKTVATFRDYQVICNLGFCLWHGDKSCSPKKYLASDFEFFYKNYVESKSTPKYYILKLAAIRAWLAQKILYYFAKKIDYKIAVSKKVSIIFQANGIYGLKVIHNPVIINKKPLEISNNKILYVGKLSKGKGVDILFNSLGIVVPKLKGVTIEVIGSGHLRKMLDQSVKDNNLSSKVKFFGQLSHDQVLDKMSKSALVIVPSVWPEPLPRSVIETILSGTPVVASNVGGIGEIVKNNRYGILTTPSKEGLEKAIYEAFNKRIVFKKNVKKDINLLKNHFSKDVVRSYMQVYKESLG